MNHSYPIYTVKAECQDCYKCVRHCPVKAIKIEDGRAAVIPEFCVACGKCVEVCPAHAKKVRDDSGRVRHLLESGQTAYVSLAPSWISEFQGIPAERMIAALRKLGFAGVSETALGAQTVSAQTAGLLKHHQNGALISSACPVIVDYIRKYQPGFTSAITALLSPALSHAKMLRACFGEDIAVVFIGPCIAKKNEADAHPDIINISLTFNELRQLFTADGIDLYKVKSGSDDHFVPTAAEEGAVYPVEGGMNKTIKIIDGCGHINFAELTGLQNLEQAFNGLKPQDVKEPVFIETLACSGGCVHGPGTCHESPGLLERLRVLKHTQIPEKAPERNTDFDIRDIITPDKRQNKLPDSLPQLKQALRSIGKNKPEDELNCGGCGYDTCRNFAAALINNKAEPSMCVSYMRKQAQKKANALLRCIPSGVVIADRELQVVECNRRFAEMLGKDTVMAFEAKPGLAGADLSRLVPFHHLFRTSLASGRDIHRDSHREGNRLFNITIFTIEPGETIGAVLMDVTNTELRREQIAERAREVINKNLSTVQDIACKLGEHMAETEILLRSISEDYADEKLLKDIKKEYKYEK
ncbi:[Fe-Fe] hydrogenase large subunit C-terminal domain-containing protein [Lentisphaerota bacterium ZTH]|nr:4Fe-4S dicluster domain-containing protein [Lentisphaerota bacterium]WET07452.1 [Fe-Fe] hydrogenase large subunit C-terminal domain-containing protein [Lentisphaerota bacterium ZTH]